MVKEVEISFEIGESVKITDGPFETFLGIVEEVDWQKKKLKVSAVSYTHLDVYKRQVEL